MSLVEKIDLQQNEEKDILSIKFKNLHFFYFFSIYLESEGSSYQMEALDTCGTWIYDQHVALGISHHLQYMRVATDKNIGAKFVYQPAGPRIVSARITADMSHQNLQSLAFEEPVDRMFKTQIIVVAITGNTQQRLELRNLLGQVHSPAEISCMPDLINRLEEIPELRAEDSVRIRYQSYVHNLCFLSVTLQIYYFCT